jgi:SAM-dependent methyltransferase
MIKGARSKIQGKLRKFLKEENPTTWSDQKSMDYHLRQWSDQKQSTIKFVDFANSWIKPSKMVLDVGCGLGAPTYWMAKSFELTQFIGLDSDKKLIAEANLIKSKKEISNLDFQVADINRLSKIQSVDGVVSFQTLLCLPSIEEHLNVILQTINPGWVAILSLFYEGDISCKIDVLEHSRQRKSFYNVYSIPYVDRLAKQRGYKIAKVEKFNIDIDIQKPNNIDFMGTYTEKILSEAGPERMQVSGPLLMNWYFLLLEKEQFI